MKKGETENLDFWTQSAKTYSKGVNRELENKEDRKWIDAVLAHAPAKDRLRILDVGCGPGYFTISFTRLGHDVTGIDITQAMIDEARGNATKRDVKADFRLMNANRLDFEDNTFDMVICRYVTWTLPDAMECYAEWKRVLVPGGRILIFDGNHYLNVFEPEKAALLRRQMREHLLSGGEVYNDHFDFHIRSEFMLTRPLIGTQRPEWDRNAMIKLDMINIETDDNCFGEDPDESMAPTFTICAEKPSETDGREHSMSVYWNGICPVMSARTAVKCREGVLDAFAAAVSEKIPAGSKVLDLGCGTGNASIPLSKTGYKVTGVDSAEFMIEQARICADEASADCDFVQADASSLPFDDGSFDAVVMRNVIWGSFRPEEVYAEASRVLRKGGVLVVTDGTWLENIRGWEESHEDRGYFPNYVKRDMGFGGTDYLDALESELPLLGASRPGWDLDLLRRSGFDAGSEDFSDPVDCDVAEALGSGFMITATKN